MNQLRSTSPLATYNRVIAKRVYQSPWGNQDFGQSQLAYFGAGEARFLSLFVSWAKADRTTYITQLPTGRTWDDEITHRNLLKEHEQ